MRTGALFSKKGWVESIRGNACNAQPKLHDSDREFLLKSREENPCRPLHAPFCSPVLPVL